MKIICLCDDLVRIKVYRCEKKLINPAGRWKPSKSFVDRAEKAPSNGCCKTGVETEIGRLPAKSVFIRER